jgi:single-stranded DNA-binding protein
MAYDDICNLSLFVGWTTAEPEHGQTGDLQWCNFSIGLAGGKKGDPKEFRKLSAYYDNAERVKKTIGKGTLIAILCRSKTKKWETKTTGEKRESMFFIVNSFLDPKSLMGASGNREVEEKTLEQAFDNLPFNN